MFEIAIAPRRNKFGRKFGFARFIKVEEVRLLAVKVDNVIIEGKKIHANLLRFERLRGKEAVNVNRREGGRKGGRFKKLCLQGAERREDVKNNIRRAVYSYTDVVNPVCTKIDKEDRVALKYISREEDRSIFSKAMMAKVLMSGSSSLIGPCDGSSEHI